MPPLGTLEAFQRRPYPLSVVPLRKTPAPGVDRLFCFVAMVVFNVFCTTVTEAVVA